MHNFIDFINSQIELSDMKSGEVILQTHLSLFANVPLMHVKKSLCILISIQWHYNAMYINQQSSTIISKNKKTDPYGK
jgi:hypothetical protein